MKKTKLKKGEYGFDVAEYRLNRIKEMEKMLRIAYLELGESYVKTMMHYEEIHQLKTQLAEKKK